MRKWYKVKIKFLYFCCKKGMFVGNNSKVDNFRFFYEVDIGYVGLN